MVWAYRLLLGLAGGLIGLALTPMPHRFFMDVVGFGDDLAFCMAPGAGVCAGLTVGYFTYSQAWFHWGSVVLGPPATALAIWQSLDFVAISDKLRGTGPLAGLGEMIVAFLYLLLAAGFTLLVVAGGMQLVIARRRVGVEISASVRPRGHQ